MAKQKNKSTEYIFIGVITILILIVGIVKFSSNPLSKDSEKEISSLIIDSVSVSTETNYNIINSCSACAVNKLCNNIYPSFELKLTVSPIISSDKMICKLYYNEIQYPAAQSEFYSLPIWNGKGTLEDLPLNRGSYSHNYRICCNYQYTNEKNRAVQSENVCSGNYVLSQNTLNQLNDACTCDNGKTVC